VLKFLNSIVESDKAFSKAEELGYNSTKSEAL
jgi:hypothetical protein